MPRFRVVAALGQSLIWGSLVWLFFQVFPILAGFDVASSPFTAFTLKFFQFADGVPLFAFAAIATGALGVGKRWAWWCSLALGLACIAVLLGLALPLVAAQNALAGGIAPPKPSPLLNVLGALSVGNALLFMSLLVNARAFRGEGELKR